MGADARECGRGRWLAQVDHPSSPGVYPLEGWLKLDSEDRPWVYSNPIYVR